MAAWLQNILDVTPVLNASIAASWLILAVIALRLLLRRAPRWTHVALWGIVALRLLMPFSVESAFSLIPSVETVSTEMLRYESVRQSEAAWLEIVTNPVFPEPVSVELSRNVGSFQWDLAFMNLIWWAGMAVMALYALASYGLLHRRVRTAVRLRDNLYQSEHIDSPFVLGILRPRIYLPYHVQERDMVHVIAHEKTHIRRKDHWWKPLGFLLLTIHWFNPLMWAAYVLLCRDIELACDERVIRDLGRDQRADYSQALLNCSVSRKTIAACPLAFGEAGVKERVNNVLNYRKPAFWVVLTAVILCVVVAVCFLTDPVKQEYVEQNSGKYYLTIAAEGVTEIEISTALSSGGCIHADGSAFQKGEKVYMEQLDGFTDLRGVKITARDADGYDLFSLSVADNAWEAVNVVSAGGWLLAPENAPAAEPTERPIPEDTGVADTVKDTAIDPSKIIHELTAEKLVVTPEDLDNYWFWTNSTKIAVSVESENEFTGEVMLWTTENLSKPIQFHEISSGDRTCEFSGLTSAAYYMVSVEGLDDCTVTLSDGSRASWLDWIFGN